MIRNLKAVLAGTSLVTVLACSAGEPAVTTEEPAGMAQQDVAEITAAINGVREMEAQGIGSGDLETGVAAYADDIVFMAPDAPARNGKDAVREWLAEAYEQFDLEVNYTFSDIIVSGDWVIERYGGEATFTPKDGGDGLVEQLKGIHIYRLQSDGTWRITHDIWNTDAPAPSM